MKIREGNQCFLFVSSRAHAISISVQVGAAVVGHLRQEEAGMTVWRKESYNVYMEDSSDHFSQQTNERNSPY